MQVVPYHNVEKITLQFSAEFIALLGESLKHLEGVTQEISNVIDLLRAQSEPQTLLNLIIFVLDLSESMHMFQQLQRNIGKLLEYINRKVDQLLSDEVLQFYKKLNGFRTSDLRANFFDSLKLKLNNSVALCRMLRGRLEQRMPIHEFSFSVDLDLFHNPKTLMKKLLFTVHHQLRKEEEKAAASVKKLERDKTSIREKKNVEKNFLIEVRQ